MMELDIWEKDYLCRTKDLLWFKETRLMVDLIINKGLALSEIQEMSEERNLFNAASSSRANEIRRILSRRIRAVDREYLLLFSKESLEMQKLLSVGMVLLTDRTFMEFMNEVFREKMITGDMELGDSDILGFFHFLQEKDPRAAKWTDTGMKKLRDNFKSILREADLISDKGNVRKIFQPIITEETKNFLNESGIGLIYRILAGIRE